MGLLDRFKKTTEAGHEPDVSGGGVPYAEPAEDLYRELPDDTGDSRWGDPHETSGGQTSAVAPPVSKPKGRRGAHTWSPEQRAAQSAKMREYWAKTTHPMKGAKLTDEQRAKQKAAMAARRDTPPVGTCERCGLPFWDERLLKTGLSDACLKKAVAAGQVRIDEQGNRIDIKPLTLVMRAKKARKDAVTSEALKQAGLS